jgi:hypothetical protein
MGKASRREKAPGPATAATPVAQPVAPDSAPPSPAKTPSNLEPTAPPQQLSLRERLLPEGGLLPWWVVLIVSVYALLKLGLTLEHPCGVLGTWTPVTRSQLNRAYRSLSMCTHPDKMVGHSPEDIARGELLFHRASKARDMLLASVREAASERGPATEEGSSADAAPAGATCSTQLDMYIYQTLYYFFGYLMDTGGISIVTGFAGFLWELVTFQYDLSMSISFTLLLITAYKTLAGFVSYLRAAGPISTVIAAFTTVLIGPLPTVWRFLCLPFLRVGAFVRHELVPFLRSDDAHLAEGGADAATAEEDTDGAAALAAVAGPDEHAASVGADAAPPGTAAPSPPGAPPASPPKAPGAAGAATAATGGSGDGGVLPRRGHKVSRRPQGNQEVAAQREAVLQGDRQEQQLGMPPPLMRAGEMPLGQLVARKPMPHWRPIAAAAIQFELLLSTTKYVIPLVALVATGQVFNGIWSSMATAQILHRVPAMRPEMHHLVLVLVGLFHSVLCASKSQLEEMQDGSLQLQWQWSVRDVLAVANVMALGATFSSASGSGNEPPFCASFASGIALRMLFYEITPPAIGLQLTRLLRDKAQIELVGVDEVAVRAGGGVGTCSGGPMRFLLGWLEKPWTLQPASIAVKAALLVLPMLAAAQWLLRSASLLHRIRREGERQGKERKLRSGERLVPVLRRRLMLSLLVGLSITACVVYFAFFELNAVGSSLGNLLIIALAGCHFESLLSTYDVRGRLRSAVFFVLFMVL